MISGNGNIIILMEGPNVVNKKTFYSVNKKQPKIEVIQSPKIF